MLEGGLNKSGRDIEMGKGRLRCSSVDEGGRGGGLGLFSTLLTGGC